MDITFSKLDGIIQRTWQGWSFVLSMKLFFSESHIYSTITTANLLMSHLFYGREGNIIISNIGLVVVSDASTKQSPSDRSALDSSISENIYGTPTLSKYTSSSRSDKKTSTPDRDSTLPSFGGRSPVRDYSSEVGVGNKVNMALHFDSKTVIFWLF